jgi:hypothetical protein
MKRVYVFGPFNSRWASVKTRDSASPGGHIYSDLCHLLPTMVHHRGDDLEDDFMPDETVALSEDEGFVGDKDDVGTLLSADEDEKVAVESPSERTKAPSEEKKRKRREKDKERKEKESPPSTPQRAHPDASRFPTEEKT